MSKEPIRVAVTGAAGQIGSLLFRIASGQMSGPDQPVALNLIEIEPGMAALEGVCMELDDCAFPLLTDVATSDLNTGFNGANWSLLVGSVPRKDGMERGDLLGINGKILPAKAKPSTTPPAMRVLVVGNLCNTNCLIAMNNAPDVPNDRFFAMTRLDENRAKTQLAQKAGVPQSVSNLCIWGNHSATQYPDFTNAKINDALATDAISDREWLEGLSAPCRSGARRSSRRADSSAASAANAIIDSVRSVTEPTAEGDWHSLYRSDGSYGVEEGLISSFPMRTRGELTIVQDVPIDDFSRARIDATVNELKEEKTLVADLLPS